MSELVRFLEWSNGDWAREYGNPRNANPYQAGSWEARSWDAGWDDANERLTCLREDNQPSQD